MVFRQPLFLLMQHLDCLVDEFIGGTIRAAFHVVLDEGLQFRLYTNRQTCKLPLKEQVSTSHPRDHICSQSSPQLPDPPHSVTQ